MFRFKTFKFIFWNTYIEHLRNSAAAHKLHVPEEGNIVFLSTIRRCKFASLQFAVRRSLLFIVQKYKNSLRKKYNSIQKQKKKKKTKHDCIYRRGRFIFESKQRIIAITIINICFHLQNMERKSNGSESAVGASSVAVFNLGSGAIFAALLPLFRF